MERHIPVVVLLPPERGAAPNRLPVLYALHGRNAPPTSFSDMAPLRDFLADHPMIIVAFFADKDSAYVDATHRPNSKFTTFFFEELVPDIERRYRASGQRAVTGFSMGGYGALLYLLERPRSFTSASSLSGALSLFDPTLAAKDRERWKAWQTELFGPGDTAPPQVALTTQLDRRVRDGEALPPLLIACGSEDHLLAANRCFIDVLSSKNAEILARSNASGGGTAGSPKPVAPPSHSIRYRYLETPGGHNFSYWQARSREIAEFHWEHFHPAGVAR